MAACDRRLSIPIIENLQSETKIIKVPHDDVGMLIDALATMQYHPVLITQQRGNLDGYMNRRPYK